MPTSDPRVFFASERTLLAWVRTGIAIVGLGFVVARFGLFPDLGLGTVAGSGPHADGWVARALGVALVALGALAIAVAAIQHGRFVTSLPEEDRPASYPRHWALWLSTLVATAGVLLAAYLALGS